MAERRECNTRSDPNQDSSDSRPVADGGNRGGNRQPRGQQGGDQRRGQQPQGGQPRQGGQGRGQPQHGQPQGGQAPQQTPPSGGRPPQGGRGRGQPAGGDESRFTRRQLLAGGGAAVAAGAGGWFFFLRGPSGAKGLADGYVSAVSNNNWSSAEELFHSDSPVSQTISDNDNVNNYEDFLEQNDQLSQLEELNPSVQNHIEFRHYSNYNEGTAQDVGGFQLPGPDNAGSIDEAKLISTVIEVDISTWFDGEDNSQSEHLAGDTTNVGVSFATVSSGGDWSIWSTQGL